MIYFPSVNPDIQFGPYESQAFYLLPPAMPPAQVPISDFYVQCQSSSSPSSSATTNSPTSSPHNLHTDTSSALGSINQGANKNVYLPNGQSIFLPGQQTMELANITQSQNLATYGISEVSALPQQQPFIAFRGTHEMYQNSASFIELMNEVANLPASNAIVSSEANPARATGVVSDLLTSILSYPPLSGTQIEGLLFFFCICETLYSF